MATTRNRRAKASPPVEVKPVEAPQAEEVKEAPKSVETSSAQIPSLEETKEASKSSSKKSSAKKTSDGYDELRESLRLRFKGRLSDAQIEHRINIVKQSKGDK